VSREWGSFYLITISTSLALSQSSNHVFGRCIMTGSLIASLTPLIKHSLKKESDRPSQEQDQREQTSSQIGSIFGTSDEYQGY
jgi:hypothetical protein